MRSHFCKETVLLQSFQRTTHQTVVRNLSFDGFMQMDSYNRNFYINSRYFIDTNKLSLEDLVYKNMNYS